MLPPLGLRGASCPLKSPPLPAVISFRRLWVEPHYSVCQALSGLVSTGEEACKGRVPALGTGFLQEEFPPTGLGPGSLGPGSQPPKTGILVGAELAALRFQTTLQGQQKNMA